jgi:precorrin-2 C20-methyltransferase/precorrin-3B C17-methyltransferase
MNSVQTGRLFGVGVGSGDPELITLRGARIVRAADVVAYPAARHGRSNARAAVAAELRPEQIEVPLIYPVTTESPPPGGYDAALRAFYDASAETLAAHLDAGRDVAVLCEGDPFFYGSYMYLHDRLAHRYPTEVVPGVCSVMAAAARLGTPLVRRDTELTILPGTLPADALTARLRDGGAYAIIKLGRNFEKVRTALRRAGVLDRAHYVERATMEGERVVPIVDVDPATVPYFSLVVVPGGDAVPAPLFSDGPGTVTVVGLGPGAAEWLSPEARYALDGASDLVGYQPYLDRVPLRPGQARHGSDNRVELERARHALALAAQGRRVCIVSSGDPGIFAMATAVMEAIEHGEPGWRGLDVRVVPGISAMQAAAARAGAPLGHDFCVLSLSDRLKPWAVIAARLEAAAAADLALALYNPVSSQRRWQLDEARNILLRHCAPETPVVVARDLSGPQERVTISNLGAFDAATVDMRTILLIGSSTTRSFAAADGRRFVYTPRSYAAREPSTRGA